MSFIGLAPRSRAYGLLFSFFVSLALVGCGNGSGDPALDGYSQCEADTKKAVLENTEKQMAFYRQYGTLPTAPNQAGFYPGTNGRAVVLVHGFIASPKSMTELAQSINQAGYTVITPLLTGFGDGPDAANAAKTADWMQSVEDAVRIAGICHKDVSLMAHSLGTALVTKSLLAGTENKVDRVVLLAPYFKTSGKWIDYLTSVVSLGSDTIYISGLQRFGIDPYEMFDFDRPAEGEREPYLPLVATREVLSLQREFADPVNVKIKVPVLAFLTESDAIVDDQFSQKFLATHFASAQFVVFPAADKVDHSFHHRRLNRNYDTMVNQILVYLEGGASVSGTANPLTGVFSAR
jgi:esterase/lipase